MILIGKWERRTKAPFTGPAGPHSSQQEGKEGCPWTPKPLFHTCSLIVKEILSLRILMFLYFVMYMSLTIIIGFREFYVPTV